MIYAQVLNNVIVNILQLDDSSLVSVFSVGFDECLQIDTISPMPQIGWIYDVPSTTFYPPLTLALVQSNLVTSIVVNNSIFITNNSSNYQYIVAVTTMNPKPQVGFSYDGTNFSPPQSYLQQLVGESTKLGNCVITQYNAQCVGLGITAANQTSAFLTYMGPLFSLLSYGYLSEAVAELTTMLADTSSAKTSLSPFVTNDILTAYQTQIQNWVDDNYFTF